MEFLRFFSRRPRGLVLSIRHTALQRGNPLRKRQILLRISAVAAVAVVAVVAIHAHIVIIASTEERLALIKVTTQDGKLVGLRDGQGDVRRRSLPGLLGTVSRRFHKRRSSARLPAIRPIYFDNRPIR